MTLHEQLEFITGRKIPVLFPSQLGAINKSTVKAAVAEVERNSRVVNIRAVVEGTDIPKGPLMITVMDHRDGYLVQLREGLRAK